MIRTNITGLVMDEKSRAILNTNDGEYEAFKAKRQKSKNEKALLARVEALERKIIELEQKLEKLND